MLCSSLAPHALFRHAGRQRWGAQRISACLNPAKLSRSCIPTGGTPWPCSWGAFWCTPTGAPWIRWSMWAVCRSRVESGVHSIRPCIFRFREAQQTRPLLEMLQVDLLFLDGAIAARAADVNSLRSLRIPVRPRNSQGVWRAVRSSRFAIFGRPKCIQMHEWGRMGTWNSDRFPRRSSDGSPIPVEECAPVAP